MPFEQSHWRKPRATIANKYEKDDISYVHHGVKVALEAYRLFDLSPASTRKMSLLDAGCGTGRCARALSPLFDKVVAYDPVAECIEMAKRECAEPFTNVEYVTSVPEEPRFDCAMSINVLEHLSEGEAAKLLSLIYSRMKPGGRVAMWYSVTRNQRVIGPLLTQEEREADDRLGISGCDINVRLFTV